jgi:3-isopropylmalate dehydrogenase
MIVRELTGGLYFAKPKKRWNTARGKRGIDTLKYTEKEIERILDVGFKLAQQRQKKLTSVDKFNVLESSRLWREIAINVGRNYPDVELEHILVDNMAMKLISQPKSFDVIVSENTFGDIISDEAAIISSSLGMLPSASISGLKTNKTSKSNKSQLPFLYEPIHGSAPDIAGQNKANPIGSILSLAMMLNLSFGLYHESQAIEKSVNNILSQGFRTSDIATNQKDIISTSDMGDLISSNI